MAKATKPARGRPVMAAADRRDTMIRVMVNRGEEAELNAAAEGTGLPLSTYLRVAALKDARAKEK